ncbi:MAG: hypothetical protein C5B51_07655 [Terriglobia bacterium]|nr:MAG: hypothetical protein C5B51_07655 [Terriglobia bacterium]
MDTITNNSDALPQYVASVPLHFHISLARTTVKMKDLFEMGPGSTFQLGKPISEPADLVINGKVLARGHIMLLNGNYMLKISEKI